MRYVGVNLETSKWGGWNMMEKKPVLSPCLTFPLGCFCLEESWGQGLTTARQSAALRTCPGILSYPVQSDSILGFRHKERKESVSPPRIQDPKVVVLAGEIDGCRKEKKRSKIKSCFFFGHSKRIPSKGNGSQNRVFFSKSDEILRHQEKMSNVIKEKILNSGRSSYLLAESVLSRRDWEIGPDSFSRKQASERTRQIWKL